MTERKRLPETRMGITRKETINSDEGGVYDMFVRVNFYDNEHAPGEVFVDILKEGSLLAGLFDVWAITLSIALQHGVSWELLRDKFHGTRFDPHGMNPRTGHHFSSLADSMAHAIDIAIINRCVHLDTEVPVYLTKVKLVAGDVIGL